MLFKRFEDEGLSQYSYAIGCPATGEIAIVDPRRDVDVYIDLAAAQGFQIAHVLETHIHADFASGALELSKRTNATLSLSGYDKEELYQVGFPHEALYEGDSLQIGSVRIQVLHTPGHTPEHLSFLVYDTVRSEDVPILMLSGDFLFVGSLGRPDLLGEESKRQLADRLFHSVKEKLTGLPDGLEIHPGHGAGSMCGAGMSARPLSTLGFERIANPYLDPKLSQGEFVETILAKVPPFPEYYQRMKKLNSQGPCALKCLPGRRAISASQFKRLVESGASVIDLRDQLSFGAGHIPGSFGIGAGPEISTWASWVVPYDKPILLVVSEPHQVENAVRSLIRVGLDDVTGFLKGGIGTWVNAGYPLKKIVQITPVELGQRLEDGDSIHLLDVRTDAEWVSGQVPGSVHIMGGELGQNLDRIPNHGTPLAVICRSGYRSTVAASILERAGFRNLLNVAGGVMACGAAGLPSKPLEQHQQSLSKPSS